VFSDDVSRLAAKYRQKGVLIDSNLFLLLVVGSYRPERISTFKRTMKYTKRDFSLLRHLCSLFEVRLTTPNILTEVDNLGRQLGSNEHAKFAAAFRAIAHPSREQYHPFKTVGGLPQFDNFGLADTVSFIISQDCLLLSDDLPLYSLVTRAGRDAINFNHLRL
jgi:hypothetical protein